MQKIIYKLIKYKWLKKIFGKALLINPKFYWRYISNGENNYRFKKNEPDNLIIKTISNYKDIESLVELGSGYGDRLKFIYDEKKIKNITGYEINKSKVIIGNELFRKKEIDIRLIASDITSRNFILDDMEFLITSMTLIYLKDNEIRYLLSKLLPKIKRGFIFQEFMSDKIKKNETYYNHDFKKILTDLNYYSNFKITYTPINYDPWNKHQSKATQIFGVKS